MRHWVCVLFCVLLAACASQPPARAPDHLFDDTLFAPPSERIDAAEVFALSDEMKAYLRTEIAGQLRSNGKHRGLAEALYQRGQLKIEYDSVTTRNASQAFAARAGNCLSLVILTAAFAKELDLQVHYQSAFLEETWSRSGNLYLRSGHVNITLGGRFSDGRAYGSSSPLTIDFLPQQEIIGLRTRSISERTVLAMYMNNRSAEALVRGQLNDAYWWAREATLQDPDFASSYNTLGVIYLRRGKLLQAEKALAHVLGREPANTRAMVNLAQVLQAQHRNAEAEALTQRAARLEPTPPFHYFNLGMDAMRRDDFRTARDLFAREVARAGYYHEFHFWLGVASFRLGEMDQATKHLKLALENSTTRGDKDIYAAKLDWLTSKQRHH